VQLYLWLGIIWSGGPVPIAGNETYLSIADEIRAQQRGSDDGIPIDSWEVRLPTTLIWLENEVELPKNPNATIEYPLMPVGKVKIKFNLDTAHIQENIAGTANVPEGYELWILVYSHEAKKYYPQNGQVNIQNGEWSVAVSIGSDDSEGEKFDIMAVLADKEARAELTSYIVNCKKIDNWDGMSEIPNGAKVYDKITIVRVDFKKIKENISSIEKKQTVICELPGIAKS
jgi:hypothetical protein